MGVAFPIYILVRPVFRDMPEPWFEVVRSTARKGGRTMKTGWLPSSLATLPRRIELAWIRLRLGSDTPAYQAAAARLARTGGRDA